MIKFTISTNRNEFQSGSAIPCKLTLTNSGERSLYVNKRLLVNYPDQQHDVFFEIVDTAGNEVTFLLDINAGDPDDEHYSELQPGDSLDKEIDLNELFKWKVGTYRLKATYENDSVPAELRGKNVWKGRIESNALTIKIQ